MYSKDLSKERIGGVGMVPVVPVMPTAAQVSAQTGMMHLRLMGDSYVRASLPSFHPASYHAIVTAIRGCPVEPSWSGSGAPYFQVTLEPQADGQSAVIKAQGVTVGRIAVYPEADIVSVDTPLKTQVEEGKDGKKDTEPGTGPQGPGVN